MNHNDIRQQDKMMNKVMIGTFTVLFTLLALIGLYGVWPFTLLRVRERGHGGCSNSI